MLNENRESQNAWDPYWFSLTERFSRVEEVPVEFWVGEEKFE